MHRLDISFRFADQALVSLGGFVGNVFLARALGISGFGEFSLLWAVVTLLTTIQWSLITSPMQFTYPEVGLKDRPALLGMMLVHVAMIGLASAALIGIGVWIWRGGAVATIELISTLVCALLASQLQDFMRRWLLLSGRSGTAMLSDAIRYCSIVVGLLFMIFNGSHSVELAVSIFAGAALISLTPAASELLQARVIRNGMGLIGRRHLAMGRWLFFSVWLQWVNANAAMYALSLAGGVGVAGGFRAAQNLLSPVISLTEAIETFLPNELAKVSYDIGNHAAWRTLMKWGGVGVVAVLFFIGLIVSASAFWLKLFFGEAFMRLSPVLTFLGVAMLVQFICYILNVAVRAFGSVIWIFRGEVAGTVGVVGTLAVTVVTFGVFGAAVSQVMGQIFKTLVLCLGVHRARR